jgi:prepilin-type N-terminal cleavage/methylation domain-containing protein
MKFKFKKTDKGMTITELMLAIAVFSVISVVLSGMLLYGFRMWRFNNAQLEVQRDARIAMDLIERNLRQASSATVFISRNSLSDPPFSKIHFDKVTGSGFETISIYQNGREIYLEKSGGGTTRIGFNVRHLSFVSVESGDWNIVSAGLCMEKATYSGKKRASQLVNQKIRIMN